MKSFFPVTIPKLGVTCAALIVLASVSFAAGPPTARNLPNLMPAPELALQHAAEIVLSPEQRSQLEGAIRDQQAASQHCGDQIRQESNALAQLLAREKPDQALVSAQFEKVLAAENEVKRLRLKLSLQTRAVLTPEQQGRLESIQHAAPSRRSLSPEQQELAAKMAKVKELIERAKAEGRDLGNVREMWKRVDQATGERRIADACQILDETEASLTALLATPVKK
jgi:Spy/CpxP family protein refolding chaperone